MARPKSLITGKPMKIEWSANWDDDLGGGPELAPKDPVAGQDPRPGRRPGEDGVRAGVHVLPAAHLRALPEPVVRGRPARRGDVQAQPRTASSWSTRTRAAAGACASPAAPTRRSTSTTARARPRSARCATRASRSACRPCARRPASAGCATSGCSSTTPTGSRPPRRRRDEQDLYEAQLDLLLDPNDPEVLAAAQRDGIPADWIDAARQSPVYKLAKEYQVALPLHPEYRTMPMVWYIPPLSPVVDALRETGNDAEDADNLFGALSSAADPDRVPRRAVHRRRPGPVLGSLRKLAAMRSYMRDVNLGREGDASIAEAVGLTEDQVYEMYRLLAIAKYEDRYVIPKAHAETGRDLEELGCSLDYDGGPGQFTRPVRSVRPPGGPCRSPSRTSTRSRRGRRAEVLVPDRGRCGPGQPAQLGRRRPAGHARRSAAPTGRGAVMSPPDEDRRAGRPRSSSGSRCACAGRSRRSTASAFGGCPSGTSPPTRLACSWLLAYPDGALLERLDGLAAAVDELPEPVRVAPGGVPRAPGRHPDRGRAAALRRDLRHEAPGVPVPDVLDQRRHPQPRSRPSCGSSRPTRGRGSRSATRSFPTTSRSSWSSPPSATGSPATPCWPSTRPPIGLLREALHDLGSAYAHVLDAVVATLPEITREVAARMAELAASGPPVEDVGLEPFPTSAHPDQEPADDHLRDPALGRPALRGDHHVHRRARSGATGTTSSAGRPAPASSTSASSSASPARCSTSASWRC